MYLFSEFYSTADFSATWMEGSDDQGLANREKMAGFLDRIRCVYVRYGIEWPRTEMNASIQQREIHLWQFT